MHISDVLTTKGADVATVPPETGVTELLQVLATRGIGAVVVTSSSGSVVGIVSERDIVRRLHSLGADLLQATVADLMTPDVQTCKRADAIDAVLEVMTNGRFRHIPVCEDDTLVGIVSIGDLVKHRIGELQVERDHLEAYISG
jgi:CBS domain-containing protein